jgi:hypothetical protein
MALLSTLIPATDEVDVWPLLKVIRFDAGSLDDSEVDEFCKILSYRTQCGKPIECIKFDRPSVNLISNGNYVRLLQKVVRVETQW